MADLVPPEREAFPYWPVEFSAEEREVISYVIDRKLTMVSPERLFSVVRACRWIEENQIPGDFVECGVWRGGVSIMASLWFGMKGVSNRTVWLYDTFGGMTEPETIDKRIRDQKSFEEILVEHEKKGLYDDGVRAYASEDEVRANFKSAGIDVSGLRFVRGDVAETLANESLLPAQIAILRLDTDWYASTLIELKSLYPRLSRNGVLLLDDYGYYEGARKAVDDYFKDARRPFFTADDEYGRVALRAD